VVNTAIKKALKTDRKEALKKLVKKQSDGVICAFSFNPKLPSISKVLQKHWKTMTVSKNVENVP
jgi:hypothetical protein